MNFHVGEAGLRRRRSAASEAAAMGSATPVTGWGERLPAEGTRPRNSATEGRAASQVVRFKPGRLASVGETPTTHTYLLSEELWPDR